MKAILTKLLEAQKKIGTIKKTDENPYYKSAYFDINTLLAEVKPILSEVGLVLMQPLVTIDGKPAIRTIIADPDSADSLEYETPLIENADPQKFGAGITYLRRFALVSFLCLEAEDDDGNTASNKVPTKAVKRATAPIKGSDAYDKQRDTIRTLATGLLDHNPTTEDIERLTRLEPTEKNYDEIIERLEILKEEKKGV